MKASFGYEGIPTQSAILPSRKMDTWNGVTRLGSLADRTSGEKSLRGAGQEKATRPDALTERDTPRSKGLRESLKIR